MKQTKIFITLTLLALITVSNLQIYSQTSASKIVSKTETVSFLIEQNKNARVLLAAQEARIADLESEVAVEKENSASVSKSYESAQFEITSLKKSNEALARAVAINEETIAKLQTDNAKQREKAKKANADKWKVVAVAAGVVILKFLIP